MIFKNFSAAKKYLESYIPQTAAGKFPGETGLSRAKELLSVLDNPQNDLKIIHVAGTSGKGSTSYLTSLLLMSHNFKTGLVVSPHLIDLRERFQINNKLISEKLFLRYLTEIVFAIDQISASRFGRPTYFEILVALAFWIFKKEQVDYAVIETGMGGWFDATNVVTRKDKLCLLTKIGFDHMKILGKTLTSIALQKAKIIGEKNVALTIDQPTRKVEQVFQEVARENQTAVIILKKNINYGQLVETTNGIIFNFNFASQSFLSLRLGLKGGYQAQNCSLALAALIFLSRRDKFMLVEKSIRTALQKAFFAGRFQEFELAGKKLIIDGAHNSQKMKSFLTSLTNLYPGEKFYFLVAFKKGKDYKSILRLIFPLAKLIVFTKFSVSQDVVNLSEDPVVMEKIVAREHKTLATKIIDNPILALDFLSQLNGQKIIVTGSLYLAGEIISLAKKNENFRR